MKGQTVLDFADFADRKKIIVFDGETTVQKIGDKTDNRPHNPDNRMVSGHWVSFEVDDTDLFDILDATKNLGAVTSKVWYHVEQPTPDDKETLQAALDAADVFVAHNAKFDMEWLLECGFTLPKSIYCTMIGEYIFARGQTTIGVGLKDTAERRDVTRKKSDLVDELFKSGVGFEAMPLDTVLEYAESDVLGCAEIYLGQLVDLLKPENAGLRPTFVLMNEMLEFLVEVQSNGIMIDLEALAEVEREFQTEKDTIEKRLYEIVETVMGDKPFNLSSNDDLSTIIYSRRVISKPIHKMEFNLGTDSRGKPLRPPRMSKAEFSRAVRNTTQVVQKTVAECCWECAGRGTFYKKKVNGEPWKKPSKCPTCGGEGAIYKPTGQTGGLKLVPEGPADAAIGGFKTDKTTLKRLILQAEIKKRDIAVEFLSKISRLNAISSYLSTFVEGIKTWTRHNGLLHPNFNQCITATGRLSSSMPNFQNLPKGKKFPVRKAIVSRFKGGVVMEADFSGLEFVAAGELSRDERIIADILNGKDVHKQTGSIIFKVPESGVDSDMRNSSKPYTFAPLYGGMGASEPEYIQKYFQDFFVIYSGHAKWQMLACETAMTTGIVTIPSGREYAFPGVTRLRGGRFKHQTRIVNYPVQGFATADIVPLACIRALRLFRKHNVRSKLIITVHDSIVVDCHPDEVTLIANILTEAMTNVHFEMKERWDYTTVLPFKIEILCGETWMGMGEFEMEEEYYEVEE